MRPSEWLDLYYFIGGGALFITLLSWPIFMVYSVRKFEKKITQSGNPRPCLWDPFWIRAYFYAWTLTLSTKNYSELEKTILDPKDVTPHANFIDKFLGFTLFTSSWIFIFASITGTIFGIE